MMDSDIELVVKAATYATSIPVWTYTSAELNGALFMKEPSIAVYRTQLMTERTPTMVRPTIARILIAREDPRDWKSPKSIIWTVQNITARIENSDI
jgi:hypothetical protein